MAALEAALEGEDARRIVSVAPNLLTLDVDATVRPKLRQLQLLLASRDESTVPQAESGQRAIARRMAAVRLVRGKQRRTVLSAALDARVAGAGLVRHNEAAYV